MGVLDQLLGQVLGPAGEGAPGQAPGQGAQGASLLAGLLEMVQQGGGLDGLLRQFQQHGLGDAISSWISTGQNQAITAAQLTRVLGQGRIGELAQRAGLPQQSGANAIAQLLPAVIDHLTPQGQVPQQGQLAQIGADLLRSLTSGAPRQTV